MLGRAGMGRMSGTGWTGQDWAGMDRAERVERVDGDWRMTTSADGVEVEWRVEREEREWERE